MLDFARRKQRLYRFRLKNGVALTIPPPTLNQQARLEGLASLESGRTKELIDVFTAILNMNTQHIKLSNEKVVDMFTTHDCIEFYKDYLSWTREICNDLN